MQSGDFLDIGINSLPVKIISIAKSMGIRVLSTKQGAPMIRLIGLSEENLKKEGFTVHFMGQWYIFYDDAQLDSIIRFIIAHELGHICKGHKTSVKRTLFFRVRFTDSRPEIETEADIFASRLLAPACVIAALGLTTPEEIMQLCGISYTAASIRAQRMEILYKRSMFGAHPLERQVIAQFRPFIDDYKMKTERV